MAPSEMVGIGMAQTVSGGIEALRAAVEGAVYCPGDGEYDESRRVWNAQINRRPAVVVMCTRPADVAAAIAYARQEELEISVRGGAHNTSGSAVGDDGLMINLSRMNAVSVDPDARRVRIGGGALLADMDAATQEHGLATPGGVVSHTGVGGLTLGGGMGWLTRKHGLSTDNLTGAEVVTTFEFRLHPVGPIVNFGFFFWEADRGTAALRLIRDTVAALPREFNVLIAALNAPPAPFVPEQHHFKPGVGLMLTGFSSAEEHAEQAERIRTALPPLFEFVSPIPYTALQQMQDEGTAWGQLYYEKGTQLPDLTDDVIAVLTEHFPKRTSPLSLINFYRLDEAYSEVAEDATAYGGGRSPRYAMTLVGIAHDLDTWTQDREWVRGLWDALQPYSLGIGDYINNMVEFEEDRIRASYGAEKYQRLARIKAIYDPQNVFRRNVNIPPVS